MRKYEQTAEDRAGESDPHSMRKYEQTAAVVRDALLGRETIDPDSIPSWAVVTIIAQWYGLRVRVRNASREETAKAIVEYAEYGVIIDGWHLLYGALQDSTGPFGRSRGIVTRHRSHPTRGSH